MNPKAIFLPWRDQDLVWEDEKREAFDVETWTVTLRTNRGEIAARYHPVPAQQNLGGAVWVGGAGGGLDGPARGLYPEACKRLRQKSIAGLRLDYRYPNELEECVLDVLVGIAFLEKERIERAVLIGHSFGGAVVITAAALSPMVEAVVPISTQTYGTGLAAQVSPRSMLLIHGADDEVLPAACSSQVFESARQPKELKLFAGARHGLDEVRDQLLKLLVSWIPSQLKGAMATPYS